MHIHLHKNARTTPAVRQEIRRSTLSERALARQYGISRTTARKWKGRDSVEDASPRTQMATGPYCPVLMSY